MSLTLSVLLALSLPQSQDPVAANRPAEPPAVVVLQSGEELTGTLISETSTHVEVRVGGDTTIGLPMTQVREIRRLPVAAASTAPPSTVPPSTLPDLGELDLGVRDQWYALHDGEGRVVGTLHATLTRGDARELRIAEEWSFKSEGSRTEITRLEVLTQGGVPLRCFYHERTQRPGERMPRDERLVRGEVTDGELVVVRTDARGTDTKRYAVDATLHLPLAFVAHFRQRPGDYGFRADRLVYDAAGEELQRWSIATGNRRRVEADGVALDVRELSVTVADRTNIEWIDSLGRTVRREVNGTALVAMRAPQDVAVTMAGSAAKAFPPAVAREATGRFSLWVPNPIWRFDAEQPAGQITATAPLYGATLTVLALEQLGAHAHLDTAADAVERWLRLACAEFRDRGRDLVEVRAQPALRRVGTDVQIVEGRRVRAEVTVFVVPTPDGGFVAACFAAPTAVHEELASDFERTLLSLELHQRAVAAEASSRRPRILPR